jgi:hypothetical protein
MILLFPTNFYHLWTKCRKNCSQIYIRQLWTHFLDLVAPKKARIIALAAWPDGIVSTFGVMAREIESHQGMGW